MTLETTLTRLRGSAAVLALALPLGFGSAIAQETPESGAASDDVAQTQQEESEGSAGDTAEGSEDSGSADAPAMPPEAGAGDTAEAPGFAPDMRVATVNESEITGADVSAFLESLPPQARQQPPQMLLSMAMQQLVLRELVLQAARDADLAEDEEVQSLLESAPNASEEDAMIQVWLQREFDERIDDAAVQETYDEVEGQMEEGAELPPIEQVRPQIEQSLRQEALGEISEELQQDADIVFFDTEGEPVDMGEAAGSAPGSGETDTEDSGSEEVQGETSGTDTEDDNSGSDDAESEDD